MNEEAGFLSAIRETPADDTARLVYADWLDEQADAGSKANAEFIRLELQMAAEPEEGLNRIRWLNKLQKLAVQFDPTWLAVVSHPKLEACRVSFQFECPKQWALLTPTDAPNVRFCESCNMDVHYCDRLQEAQDHTARGNCVAVSLARVRREGDLYPPPPIGTPFRLSPEMTERLGVAKTIDLPRVEPPVPCIDWIPIKPPLERRSRRRKSKKDRKRNRNLERENWEQQE